MRMSMLKIYNKLFLYHFCIVPTSKKKRKIAIIAGSRGEYGYFQPIMRAIEKHPSLDYGLIVSNMHVLDRFGSSVDEIKKTSLKLQHQYIIHLMGILI